MIDERSFHHKIVSDYFERKHKISVVVSTDVSSNNPFNTAWKVKCTNGQTSIIMEIERPEKPVVKNFVEAVEKELKNYPELFL